MDYKKKFSLENKVIIITGACGLVGRALCDAVSQFGGIVIAADILESNPSKFAEELANKNGTSCVGINVNVADRKSVENLKNVVTEKYGRVDGLVNAHQNKSHLKFEPFEEVSDENWDTVIDVNLKGTFLTCQIIGSEMANIGSGVIVNFPSTYSVVAPNQNLYKGTSLGCPAAYSASKGGVDSLSRYLASYWANKGVRVNMITPHGVWNNHEKEFEENFAKFSPMERMSQNHEVAPALIFLLSDASSYTTGHNLLAEGGWTVW